MLHYYRVTYGLLHLYAIQFANNLQTQLNDHSSRGINAFLISLPRLVCMRRIFLKIQAMPLSLVCYSTALRVGGMHAGFALILAIAVNASIKLILILCKLNENQYRLNNRISFVSSLTAHSAQSAGFFVFFFLYLYCNFLLK